MISFARILLLVIFGVNAIEDNNDTAFRVFRGEGAERRGQGRMRHHRGSHYGHKRNHTWGNYTDRERFAWLNQTCAESGIICSDVSADVLDNCTNFTYYDHQGNDLNRDLLVIDEETGSYEGEDEELTKLRGSAKIFTNRALKSSHHGSDGQQYDGNSQGNSLWGNLTDTELETMRMNHLTCRCCNN